MIRTFGNVTIILILAAAFFGSIISGVFLTAVEIVSFEHFYIEFGDPPVLNATSWVVFDAATGKIFASYNSDEQVSIASITKLPAAAVLYEQHDIWATTTISASDVAAEGRAGRLEIGQEYSLHTLLFPLLLESSNDAAAVFERVEDTLVDTMNVYAQSLELKHTSFSDSSGLSNNNLSTARELATLSRAIYDTNRYIFDITSLKSYLGTINGWMNNNPFIYESGYIGGKHGYTPQARSTAIAFFDERLLGTQKSQSVGYVLLGSTDLMSDMAQLREYVQTHVRLK
ncbi:MAG: serine hydrolase [Candidatus Paceibacterota bacterium]